MFDDHVQIVVFCRPAEYVFDSLGLRDQDRRISGSPWRFANGELFSRNAFYGIQHFAHAVAVAVAAVERGGIAAVLKVRERLQVGPGDSLTVKPGAALSLQLHYKRAEHWVVVRGRAKVTRNEDTLYLNENESTYIPIGTKHRLENPGTEPLEVIEVQSGSYLGEDDIVRFEDRYNRAT